MAAAEFQSVSLDGVSDQRSRMAAPIAEAETAGKMDACVRAWGGMGFGPAPAAGQKGLERRVFVCRWSVRGRVLSVALSLMLFLGVSFGLMGSLCFALRDFFLPTAKKGGQNGDS